MLKKLALSIFIFSTYVGFSQGEANIWYFGQNAGLDFNSGSPVALTDGQLDSHEGTSVLSNALGQLLFYTNGVSIYNKNHQIMPNGSSLFGDSSSTQSSLIVQKPNSNNLYYLFTVDDEAGPNGFCYSVINLNLDGGLGAVTSQKNITINSPTCEKLTAVKHANNIDYWIITHSWNNNTYNCYLLTSTGLSLTPVQNNIGVVLSTSPSGDKGDAVGAIKISPDGSKLAACNYKLKKLELFDFDTNTGIISNEQLIYFNPLDNFSNFYGVEFSIDSKVLYATKSGVIMQFDLNANPISNSLFIVNPNDYSSNPLMLQLGPDNKIYIALLNSTKLGVINNPITLGFGCGFQNNYIDLNGKICFSGLPNFCQSFFNPTIQLQNACVGESTSFQLNNSAVTSTVWNFGDGNTSTLLNPSHSYNAAGTYTVTVTATSPSGVGTNTRDIIISEIPTATQPPEMKICDTDNDGFAIFDLTMQNNAILNGQSATQNQIKYFASAADYTLNTAIANPTNYTNSVAFGLQTIIVEVSNLANNTCKSTTNFTIQVFKTAVAPTSTIPAIHLCDNTSFGTDNDGKVVFNLSQNESSILNGQSLTEYSVTYFTDSGFLNQIVTPTNYVNTSAVEIIYVKITTIANTNCFVSTSFAIEVYSLPVVNTIVSLKQCDDDNDGFSAFNLTEANQLLVASTTGLTFSYFETANDAQNNVSSITNSTAYTNQLVSNDVIFVRVQNANGCYRVATLNLNISTTLIPASFQRNFVSCDSMASGSNTDGISNFDFSSVTAEIQALYPSGQLLNITYYKNLIDALAEINSITNISNYSNVGYPNTQNIYVRVDSQLNNECLGLGHHITLNVEALPIVQPQIIKHCDDNQDGFYGFNTSTIENTLLNGLTNVSVTYTDSNGMSLSSPLPNPFISNSQTINVLVTNNTVQACSYNTTVQFIVDDLPEAFPISTNLTLVCDDEVNPILQNGMFAFDTSTFQSTILGTQTGMIVNYFDENGNLLSSPLPNPFITYTQNILVEVINPLNTACKSTMTIPFVVKPIPLINLDDTELICSDNPTFIKIIDAGLLNPSTSSNYTYSWYFNGNIINGQTSYSFQVNTEGIYTVDVTNNQGCTRTRTITVTASNSAVISSINVTDFSDNNTIQIFTTGLGEYVYSLDGINYQQSSLFTNVSTGTYTVIIKDLKGCDEIQQTIYVMGVPKFFTPNGDGFNDFWTINNYNPNEFAKVNVFDRYGKLLHQFNPKNNRWDGKYNGQDVVSTDYWYLIEFANGKTIKGHFALKR